VCSPTSLTAARFRSRAPLRGCGAIARRPLSAPQTLNSTPQWSDADEQLRCSCRSVSIGDSAWPRARASGQIDLTTGGPSSPTRICFAGQFGGFLDSDGLNNNCRALAVREPTRVFSKERLRLQSSTAVELRRTLRGRDAARLLKVALDGGLNAPSPIRAIAAAGCSGAV
jgi:hypothetical protein